MKIDPSEYAFNETLRAKELKEDIKTKMKEIKLISTQYGDKKVAILDNDTQVFLNSLSLEILVNAFGDDTDNWLDKDVVITIENSERTRGRPSIIVKPAVTEEEVIEEKKKK